MKKSLLIALIMVMLLAACAPVTPPPAPAAIQPTVETQALAPTAVPTQTAQPAPAPTEAPSPAPTQASAAPMLTDNPWQWVAYEGPVEKFDVETPANYLLTFNQDGTISVKADCNNAAGSYTAQDGSLTIALGPMTMAACPPGSRSDQFVRLLGGAARYSFHEGNLWIELMADGGTMTFAPAGQASASPTLTTNPWQWVGFTSPVEQFKLDQPGNYLITFQEDGTVAIKADCNNAGGTYTADDSSLTIKVGPTTMAACPDGSRGEQFVELLSGAAKYFFVDNAVFITLMADGGIMRLDPGGEAAASPEAAAAAAAEAAQLQAMVAGVTANPWKWTAYSTAAEAVTVETPASYMVTFKDDGTVEIKADCNNASGTYTQDGANVTIKVGPTTLAACPSDSRGEQFLQLLGDAAQMVPLEGKLYITLKTEGSTMILDAVVTTVADLCGEKALAINTIEDTLAPEVSATLDQGLVSLVQAGARVGPGASMLIITPKGRYYKSTGVADVTTCKPLPADSPFQIGSNTKMMTSAIIFQLQEEGVLSTTDLLSKWLPDLAAQLPYGDQITIDMMLTHTSGLHDYFDLPTKDGAIANGTTIEDGTKDKAMLTRDFTPEELVQVVADSGLSDFEPGAEGKWNYSNTGYILLGLIIEKATGQSYEENLKARIFEPLDLQQTYLQTGQPEAGALPQAYYTTPFAYTTGEWNASQGWSAGAVVSTPEEFAVFLKALFTGKLFKESATLKLMQEHTAAGVDALGPGTIYAHGLLDNHGVLGHGGETLGFQSDGGYIPDKDVTIVMWSNAAESNVVRTIVPEIAKVVTGAGQ